MSVQEAYESLRDVDGITALVDESMARHTTLRVGGPAALFLTCDTYPALRRAVDALGACGVPWVIIGRGSCIIASDEGYAGAVITLGTDFRRLRVDDDQVMHVGAAVNLQRAVQDAFSRGLVGIEGFIGIPGTVGGAVSTNALSGDFSIGSVVDEVVTYRPGSGFARYAGNDVGWFRRVTDLPGREVILEVALRLSVGDIDWQRRQVESTLSSRGSRQPIRLSSVDAIFADPATDDGIVSASELISSCGMAGYTKGRAQAYEKDPNYVVNLGGARASDVTRVIIDIMAKVRKQHGIELRPEVKFLGFPS
jgi:UDP-N-acetylmuramate dehydrogenase